MTEKRKKLFSRWSSRAVPRYSAERIVDDEQAGDAVTELTWLLRRHEAEGWRKGARVRKL